MTAEEEARGARGSGDFRFQRSEMDDDLTTADALGVIFEYVRDMNASGS